MGEFWVFNEEDEEVKGPFSPEEIQSFDNYLDLLVQPDGGEGWTRARNVDELSESKPAPPDPADTPDPPKPDAPSPQAESSESSTEEALIDATRRNVTVLFGRVNGLSRMNEDLGAEKGRALSNELFERFVPQIEELGGEVDKYMGEKIMALFGATETHPDDPRRAIQAGLAMIDETEQFIEEHDLDLTMKAGVNTGKVVAGQVGGGGEEDFSVMGSGVNLAARLTSTADEGTVLIGPETEKRLQANFEVKPEPGLDLQGIEEEVTAFVVTGTKPTSLEDEGVAGGEGRDLSFVSRDEELSQLSDVLESEDKWPGALVVGEAGVGKTRLIQRFLRRHVPESRPIVYTQGQPNSERLPFNTLLPLFDHLLGIDDPSERPRSREDFLSLLPSSREELIRPLSLVYGIQSGEEEELGPESEVTEAAPDSSYGDRGTDRYGVELEERDRDISDKIQDQLARFIYDSLDEDVVLEIDDAQWADDASLALVKSVMNYRRYNDRRVVLLMDSRPVGLEGNEEKPVPPGEDEVPGPPGEAMETDDRDITVDNRGTVSEADDGPLHRQMGNQLEQLVRVDLEPLGESEVKQLLSENFPGIQLGGVFLDRLMERTGGIPIHLEQTLWALIDRGMIEQEDGTWQLGEEATEIPVPSTLTDLIVGRIDQLDDKARETLLVSAALGVQFEMWLLVRVLDRSEQAVEEAIEQLLERGFMRKREGEFIFQHTTIQEVSYGLLLEKDRENFHGRAADALQEKDGADPDRMEDIARHLRGAKRWDELVRLRIQGIEQTLASYSYDDAERMVEDLEEIDWPEELSDEWRARYLTARGRLARERRRLEEAADFHRQALQLKEDNDQVRGQAIEHWALGKIAHERGLNDESEQHHETVLELANEVGDDHLRAMGYWGLARIAEENNEWETAREYNEEALELDRRHNNLHGQVIRLGTLGGIAEQEGEIDRAIEYNRDALEIIRELGDDRGEAFHLGTLGRLSEKQGRLEEALHYVEQAMEIDREINEMRGVIIQYHALGRIAEKKSNYDEAEGHIEQALELEKEHPNTKDRAILLGTMGRIYEKRGDLDEAFDYFRKALDLNRERNDERGESIQLGALGRVARKKNRLDEAEEYVSEALERAELRQDNLGQSIQLNSMGKIALKQGRIDDARQHFQKAANLSEEVMDWKGQIQQYSQLADISQRMGYLDEALSTRRDILDLQQEMKEEEGEAETLLSMARLHSDKEEYVEAQELASRGFELAKRLEDPSLEAEAQLMKARLSEADGRSREAVRHSEEALELAEGNNNRGHEYGAHVSLALVYAADDSREQCQEHLRQAQSVYRSPAEDEWIDEGETLGYREVKFGVTRLRCMIQLGDEDEALRKAKELHKQAIEANKGVSLFDEIRSLRELMAQLKGEEIPSTREILRDTKGYAAARGEDIQLDLKTLTFTGKIKRLFDRVVDWFVQSRPEAERKVAQLEPVDGPGFRAEFQKGDRGLSILVLVDCSHRKAEKITDSIEYPTSSLFTSNDESYEQGFYVDTSDADALDHVESVLEEQPLRTA